VKRTLLSSSALATLAIAGAAFFAPELLAAVPFFAIGAVANTKSTTVTNLDSTPMKQNRLDLMGGKRRGFRGIVEVAAADDNASVYRVARVHSSWTLTHLWIYNDAIASGSAFDLGLYETLLNGGAAVDVDLFATDLSMTAARTTSPIDALFEALNIDQAEKRIWEQLGLSADPNKYYDLAFTADTVGTAAGTILVDGEFSDGT
jgi:hypothetical protein